MTGLFLTASRRVEPGPLLAAIVRTHSREAISTASHRLCPVRLTEVAEAAHRINVVERPSLRLVVLAQQRHGQALWMSNAVEAGAAHDAQPLNARRARWAVSPLERVADVSVVDLPVDHAIGTRAA